jgi:hypothetical protein
MTREDAIDELSVLYERCIKARQFPNKFYCSLTDGQYIGALDMAIEALEQKPCEDCISRAEAIKRSHIEYDDDGEGYRVVYVEEIEDLPSVTPQPKTGEWLEKEVISDKVIEEWQSARCSVCDGYHTTPYMYYFSHYEYCPNCGHRMRKEAEI